MADSLTGLRSFTNADVERANRKKLGVTIERPQMSPSGQAQESIDDLLAEAYASLDRANALGDQSDLANLPASLAALQAEQEAARPASLHDITEGASTYGGYAGLASLVPGPQSPVLAGAATALMAPNALRHLLAPEEDETRLGGLAEAGLALGPAALSRGVRAVRGSKAIPLPPSLGTSWGRAAGPKPATLAETLYGESTRPQALKSAEALIDEAGITRGAEQFTMPRTARSVSSSNRLVAGAGETPGTIEAFQPSLEEVHPALTALRHTMGRAAKDVTDRRVNLSGQLPEGMSERRMDELVAQFGGTAAPNAPPRAAHTRIDTPLTPEGVLPLNLTKTGYLQTPGTSRTHRRGWNAKQVEEARQRALLAIKGLALFQGK